MDSRQERMLASDLFTELGSEIRCSMLFSLNKEPAKLSSLARQLDITVQHAHQNVNRLYEAGLVDRGDGTFHITEFGRIVAIHIPYFLFAKKHSTFFKDHTLGGIPEKFVQRIGSLQNCKKIDSVTAVLQGLKKMESAAEKSLRVMVSQAWPEEGEIFIDRAGHGVEIRTIIGSNTVVPRNVKELIGPRLDELALKGLFKGRMVEHVDIAVYIADNSCAAMFPNSKGEVDMSSMFVGEDEMFCEWCSDYFEYIWERSKPLNTSKIKIVEY